MGLPRTPTAPPVPLTEAEQAEKAAADKAAADKAQQEKRDRDNAANLRWFELVHGGASDWKYISEKDYKGNKEPVEGVGALKSAPEGKIEGLLDGYYQSSDKSTTVCLQGNSVNITDYDKGGFSNNGLYKAYGMAMDLLVAKGNSQVTISFQQIEDITAKDLLKLLEMAEKRGLAVSFGEKTELIYQFLSSKKCSGSDRTEITDRLNAVNESATLVQDEKMLGDTTDFDRLKVALSENQLGKQSAQEYADEVTKNKSPGEQAAAINAEFDKLDGDVKQLASANERVKEHYDKMDKIQRQVRTGQSVSRVAEMFTEATASRQALLDVIAKKQADVEAKRAALAGKLYKEPDLERMEFLDDKLQKLKAPTELARLEGQREVVKRNQNAGESDPKLVELDRKIQEQKKLISQSGATQTEAERIRAIAATEAERKSIEASMKLKALADKREELNKTITSEDKVLAGIKQRVISLQAEIAELNAKKPAANSVDETKTKGLSVALQAKIAELNAKKIEKLTVELKQVQAEQATSEKKQAENKGQLQEVLRAEKEEGLPPQDAALDTKQEELKQKLVAVKTEQAKLQIDETQHVQSVPKFAEKEMEKQEHRGLNVPQTRKL